MSRPSEEHPWRKYQAKGGIYLVLHPGTVQSATSLEQAKTYFDWARLHLEPGETLVMMRESRVLQTHTRKPLPHPEGKHPSERELDLDEDDWGLVRDWEKSLNIAG